MNEVIHIELEWKKVWDRIDEQEGAIGDLADDIVDLKRSVSENYDSLYNITQKLDKLISNLQDVTYKL